VEVRPTLALRFNYDERIEDGMYAYAALERLRALIEHPEAAL
jgi:pyruvate/2-oxoglutarate dehydrogenase complex dihydrolipoamide acyltransferase (E2) component